MKKLMARFVREQDGQDIIEYALLAAFISIAAYTLLQGIGNSVNSVYNNINTATNNAASSSS